MELLLRTQHPQAQKRRTASPMETQAQQQPHTVGRKQLSLYLEGDEFGAAVEKLHTLYRDELQQRRVPQRSVSGCLAGLRRKTNRSNWYQVQEEARQRLTGSRREAWQAYEYAATHEKRRRRRGLKIPAASCMKSGLPGTYAGPAACALYASRSHRTETQATATSSTSASELGKRRRLLTRTPSGFSLIPPSCTPRNRQRTT